jgi:hypothetical protein
MGLFAALYVLANEIFFKRWNKEVSCHPDVSTSSSDNIRLLFLSWGWIDAYKVKSQYEANDIKIQSIESVQLIKV